VTKFKYRIINNHRQYLVNSVEEYIRDRRYRGQSLNIEMAPRDGWFDVNGNRCAMSLWGKDGEKFDDPRVVRLANWEYYEDYQHEEVLTLKSLSERLLISDDNIALAEGGNVPIICTYPNDRMMSVNVLLDISGKDQHIVRFFNKKWKNVICVL